MGDTTSEKALLLDGKKLLVWMYENGYFSLRSADMIAEEMEKGTFDLAESEGAAVGSYIIDEDRGRLIRGKQEWHIVPHELDITLDEFFDDFGGPKWLEELRAENERLQAEIAEADGWYEYWRREAFRKYPTPEAYEAACKALEKHRAENERRRAAMQLAMGVWEWARRDDQTNDLGERMHGILYSALFTSDTPQEPTP